MLARGSRLTTTQQFEKLRKDGKLLQSDSFSLVYLNRKDENPTRFGFIVSTKVSKNATSRNKVKRALREGVRQAFTKISTGYDCVFLAKPISVRKYTDELMREVGKCLDEIGAAK